MTPSQRPLVLLAGDFPERPPMVVGGIQAVTWQLAGGIAAIGDFEVRAVASERFWQAPPARLWQRRWDVCTAHYRRSPRRLPHVLGAWTTDAEYVRREVHSSGARLVHAHGQVGYTIGAIRSGVPHVITPHGMLVREKRAPAGARALSAERLRETLWSRTEDWCLAHAEHVVAISPYVRRLIAPRTRARVHEIPNPVDPAFFALARGDAAAAHAAAADPARSADAGVGAAASPVVLSVGWLNARKRHDLLIRALACVRERVPGVRLRIVGNVDVGHEQREAELRRLAHELGVGEAVRFLKRLSQEELLQEYARADLYAHAAEEESSPVAVAQAMAAGLPLCAVEIPGLAHLLSEGATGIYARAATPAALAAAIAQPLEDRALARALGERARREAQARFHPAAVAAATTDLYHEVLAR